MRSGQIGFSCWGLIFAISESTQYPALIILSFLLSTFSNDTKCASLFVSEKKKRPVVIEQTRFLGTVFLCSEFKLENTVSPLQSTDSHEILSIIFSRE